MKQYCPHFEETIEPWDCFDCFMKFQKTCKHPNKKELFGGGWWCDECVQMVGLNQK
jgi:hypothetical protein